jgi:UDP-N-acetylmuramoylalanine--D-glutamate ligase
MIDLSAMKGQRLGVLGLARSGLSTVRALVAAGAEVVAWDDDAARLEPARKAGAEIADLATCDLKDISELVIAPGIPHTLPKPHPAALRARKAGISLIGDIELLARATAGSGALFVGITGTNGKSTTTALIGHVLAEGGVEVRVGGNLGIPVLDFDPAPAGGVYVIELSSYQLELVKSLALDVAVWLNISPDHLDRHGGMEGYIAAKMHLFDRARPGATAVIGVDDAASLNVADEINRRDDWRVIEASVKRPVDHGVHVLGSTLLDATGEETTPIVNLSELKGLRGPHNWQNAALAYAAARRLGVAPKRIARALAGFPGLPHRQQLVAGISGVSFVNDSKATNAESAATALACHRNIYWIAGGKPKSGGLSALAGQLGPIRRAFTIGEAGPDFAKWLNGHDIPAEVSGDLATATRAAFDAALKDGLDGATVLLSPAAASFDQFANYEERGERFAAIVRELDAQWRGKGAA